eukprot:scaffold11465_cov105-Isochrysis_galbana.AAC.8
MFCSRSVASSSGRRPHPLTSGSSSNLFDETRPDGTSTSTALDGQRPAAAPWASPDSIQPCTPEGLPMYPAMTEGSVPLAPRPTSMPSSFTYGESGTATPDPPSCSEVWSGSQPRPTAKARPASPASSDSSSSSSGRSSSSPSLAAADAGLFTISSARETPCDWSSGHRPRTCLRVGATDGRRGGGGHGRRQLGNAQPRTVDDERSARAICDGGPEVHRVAGRRAL